MRFEPCQTNICHSDYNKYSNFAKDIVQKLVLNYHAQSGTDYSCLQSWMIEDFKWVLESIGKDCDSLREKAWDILRRK